MKSRPRFAENRVALYLSDFFVARGFSPVERQPVNGRTGPDLTINEVGLVVDVKSRLEIPRSYICPWAVKHGSLMCIPLADLPKITGGVYLKSATEDAKVSKIVEGYYRHMQSWTLQKMPDGITAVVLHRPGLRFALAQLVIHVDEIQKFEERICQPIKSQ